ncbi:hypothetical protein [Solitalea lacus]|uniref:hypothetical protein n=1 Tax=Solitalea lacus TaxID=2911172 RepID=UPI001EDBC6D9|nr:hypothetical protein [Solitalea lacus]UKJ06639.1 hypothetical protein L2B55_14010 [Solitalea lacus]
MKKITFLILTLLTSISLLVSCKNDAEPQPTFEGSWKLQSAEVLNYNSKNELSSSFAIPISQFAEKDKLEIEFKVDKIISQVDADGNAVITSLYYRIDGSTILVKTGQNAPETVFGNYSLTTTDLTIVMIDVNADGQIATKLVYKRK